MGRLRVPTLALYDYFIFELGDPWEGDQPITREDIDRHLSQRGPDEHLQRIAKLIDEGLDTSRHPIDLELCWPGDQIVLHDGCHRLHAAWYLQHESVWVDYSGIQDDEAFFSILGIIGPYQEQSADPAAGHCDRSSTGG